MRAKLQHIKTYVTTDIAVLTTGTLTTVNSCIFKRSQIISLTIPQGTRGIKANQ